MKCIVCIWQDGDPHDAISVVNGSAVCVHHLDSAMAMRADENTRSLITYVMRLMQQKAVPK